MKARTAIKTSTATIWTNVSATVIAIAEPLRPGPSSRSPTRVMSSECDKNQKNPTVDTSAAAALAERAKTASDPKRSAIMIATFIVTLKAAQRAIIEIMGVYSSRLRRARDQLAPTLDADGLDPLVRRGVRGSPMRNHVERARFLPCDAGFVLFARKEAVPRQSRY